MVPRLDRQEIVRLWLHRQRLAHPRGERRLTAGRLTDLLEAVGGLQVDTINVVERAHLLTLWSRFGCFERESLDTWLYGKRLAYEYWGHEASILPISHLPLGRRRMRSFPPPRWTANAWWERYRTSLGSRRRVLRRIREEGPLESADFEPLGDEFGPGERPGGGMPLAREDKRSLKLLWHSGRLAVADRRRFRLVYDLAERVYPETPAARASEYADSWLRIGLSGNGVAGERHLAGYWTAPDLYAEERRAVIERGLAHGNVHQVRVEGRQGRWFVLERDLDELPSLDPPRGTTLLSPFDSLLWQRKRAEDLLDFRYRVEIYVPESKRKYGYYAMPILHEGRLVGRLDPKLHRQEGRLEIKSIFLEDGFDGGRGFDLGLRSAIEDLAKFVGAREIDVSEPQKAPA